MICKFPQLSQILHIRGFIVFVYSTKKIEILLFI